MNPVTTQGGATAGTGGTSRPAPGVPGVPPPVLAAYGYCETVTGQQARNFAHGIRLLPAPKRRAMSALYALARRVDDIGDGELDAATKTARLAATRALVARVRAGEVAEDDTDPVAVALADTARRYPVPLDALDELLDGVLMDVRGRTYRTWEELRDYCRCVAGAVGRLSLGVFGTVPGVPDAARAPEYANTLGLALQLTNILRDLREDAEEGRSYLPREDLTAFGCPDGRHAFREQEPPAGADLAGLVHYQVQRARRLFADGYRLLPMLDCRSGACVAAMAGIYHALLERIAADPGAVLRTRVTVPGHRKALVAVRGLTGLETRAVRRDQRRGRR
ncbi:presqualene diphosphate synthase HpnD [Streptomyces sp. TRM 70351]|uniref:presqualene diphosphate synthase HpnD n=1 Tax=Streptomyces sp. TRM 70351 TaxID=3116552 RepID=UPI002E7BAC3F|nr:presqualene diphosphate synthase HpnD [Streptomyces sp. TRM 70351]MEE1927005.1 presqualene diphosphate synthase HpnD [Streptomyces sp. TRM 70351]